MIVTITGFKGGIGKTTSAVHLAAYLATKGSTLLVDGDPNRSATTWTGRGKGFPFTILDARETRKQSHEYEHVVIDTQARPTREELHELASGCDLLVLPVTPDAMAIDATMLLLSELTGRYRLLLTIVPPRPSQAGDRVREGLARAQWPVFRESVRRLSAFQRAATLGCLVQDVPGDPRAVNGWESYKLVGKELLRCAKT